MNAFRLGASVSGVAAVVIFAQPVYAQISAEQRRVEEIAKEVTVYLEVPNSGSGVLIKRVRGNNGDYVYTVLTAYHVVQKLVYEEEYYLTVQKGNRNERKYRLKNISTNLMRRLGNLDLAIAQFTSNERYEVAAIGDSKKLNPNEAIYVAGFPKPSEKIPEIYLRFRIGSVDTMLSQPNMQGYQLVYDNSTIKGMSGGAVLNKNGALVAIHGEGETTDNGKQRNLGIPTALFRDQLDNGDRQTQTVSVARIVSPQKPIRRVIDQSKTSANESDSAAKDRAKPRIFARLGSVIDSNAFSPDGRKIVAGLTDGTLRLFDAISGNPIGDPFQGHEDWIYSVAFSADGKAIVSSGLDKTLRLWDLQGNQIGAPFRGHENAVNSVAFSPDGKTMVSGSDDKTLRLWDLQGNQIGAPFRGHENAVWSVAFSPDGKAIVSGSADKTLRLWDLQGNQIGVPFRGHKDLVRSVAFSPDGKAIVSGSFDKTLRLWDLQGNQIGAPFRGHEDWVLSVAFSPDGKAIVSGSFDKTLRLWDLLRREP